MIVLCNISFFEGNGLLHKFAYLGYCGNHRTVCDLYKKFGMQNKTARLGEFLITQFFTKIRMKLRKILLILTKSVKSYVTKTSDISKPKSRVTKINPGYKC